MSERMQRFGERMNDFQPTIISQQITLPGDEWADIANELVWESGNAIDIDELEALRVAVETQLPDEYWERTDEDEPLTVTLTAEQAQLLTELRTKWEETAE